MQFCADAVIYIAKKWDSVVVIYITFTFSHLADAFIQSDLQLGST